MSNNKENLNPLEGDTKKEKDENEAGYPLYPESEDIYEKFKKKVGHKPRRYHPH